MDIVNCKNCHNENCKDRGANLRTICWAYKERQQPITNADRIRSKSDEELAEWLSCNCTGDGYGNSAEDWFDWLRQEATDG